MRRVRSLGLSLLLAGCAHAVVPPPAPPPIPPRAEAPARSPVDLSWDAVQELLAEGRFAAAERDFTTFAAANPSDPRTSLARLEAALLALLEIDEAAGLARAAPLAEAAAPALGHEDVLAAIRLLVAARSRALREKEDLTGQLASCKKGLIGLQDSQKELALARAGQAKLQQDLARKDRALEDVKQRLLEIQELAAEMLGAKPARPPPPAAPATAPQRRSSPRTHPRRRRPRVAPLGAGRAQ